MPEEKKVTTKKASSADKVKVTNNYKKTVNLANGQIESGKTGTATAAELATLDKLEVVK